MQMEERVEVWREYLESLMNVENEWERIVNAEQVLGLWEEVTVQNVREVYEKMKQGRAAGPCEACTEMLGEIKCPNVVSEVVNELLFGGKLPELWENSKVVEVPWFKGNRKQQSVEITGQSS